MRVRRLLSMFAIALVASLVSLAWLGRSPPDEGRVTVLWDRLDVDLSTLALWQESPVADAHLVGRLVADRGDAIELVLRKLGTDRMYRRIGCSSTRVSAILSLEPTLPSVIRCGDQVVASGPSFEQYAGQPVSFAFSVLGDRAVLRLDGNAVLRASGLPSGFGGVAIRAVYGSATLHDVQLVEPPRLIGMLVTLSNAARAFLAPHVAVVVIAAFAVFVLPGTRQGRSVAFSTARQLLTSVARPLGVLSAIMWLVRIAPKLEKFALLSEWASFALVPTFGVATAVLTCRRLLRDASHRARLRAFMAVPLVLVATVDVLGFSVGLNRTWNFAWAREIEDVRHLWYFDPDLVPFFDNYLVDQTFRSRRVSPEPDPDRLRVLVMGGSQVWGASLQRDVLVPLLTDHAEQRIGADGIEVLNGGVQGGTTWNLRLLFESRARSYSPDVVVLEVWANDIGFDWGHLERYQQISESHRHALWRVAKLSSTAAIAARIEALLDRTVGIVFRLLAGIDVDKRVSRLEDNIRAIRAGCAQIDAELVLIGEPDRSRVRRRSGVSRHSGHPLEDLAKELDVAYFDLEGALARTHESDLFVDGTHYSLKGHRVAGGALADFLLEDGVLSRAWGRRAAR